ncbi:ku family DNA helicase [Mucor ambiguus]|uniref:Ku family DNA helicase n=1 Tax=Mucor ambiguus TaxID=91626 RepID=A0A0C9MKX9_9FUNG|nr:ku family DNA helicase [Mucor ambiguus]
MANKKATVFILNVSNSMSKDFGTALSVMTEFIEDKVMSGRKTDMVSVLLAGTLETNNVLNDTTPGQYERITSMCPISQPNLDLLRRIQNISTSSEETPPADVLDAVIVATQVIRDHCKHLKYEKRIILITDNHNRVDWLDLEDVAGILRELNTRLTVIGSDFDLVLQHDCPDDIAENYKNWKRLIEESGTRGETMTLEEAYVITQEDVAKEVRPMPAFRGYLYLGDPHKSEHVLGIPVFMFLRTKTLSLPTGHKYSIHSSGPSHKVGPDVMYKVANNANAKVDPLSFSLHDADEKIIADKSRLEQAFRFGKTVILISRDEVVSNKFTSKKELTVIGFIDKKDFKRHYLHSNAYILTAGNTHPIEAAKGLAAFAKALYDEQSCAIVRYVQKDDGRPRIGILEPEDIQGEHDVEYLLQYFDLPFTEDIRAYKLKSSPDEKVSDPKCIQLMDDLVDTMDLKRTMEGNDYLTPEYSFNPIFWRFQRAIKDRALNPDAPIPDIKDSFQCQFQIHNSFKETAGDYSERLVSLLNVRKVIDKGRGKRKYNDMDDTAEPETRMHIDDLIGNAKLSQYGPVYTPATPVDTHSSSKAKLHNDGTVTAVGLITPVEDFYALLNQPSDFDKVDSAMESMCKVIDTYLAQMFKNENFAQVINCLRALRGVAIEEEAALNYNKQMRKIKQWCDLSNKSSNRYELWELLKKEELGLVTNEESEDIENVKTTKEVADKFWNTDEEDEYVLVEKVSNAQINNHNEDKGGFRMSDIDDLDDDDDDN